MKRLGKVGVLYGGVSSERDVSLMSGQGVYDALSQLGVDAHLFDTGRESIVALANQGFDRVFIALHGEYGEDGSIQGVLECLGIPYTGSGVLASSLAMDKIMTKRVWCQAGIPTPKFAVCVDVDEVLAQGDKCAYPMMLKTPRGGSTLGIQKVDHPDQVADAFAEVRRFSPEVLVEAFVSGRELTVAVIDIDGQACALPIVEIKAPGGNYDYQSKYFSDATQYECPAVLSDELTKYIQSLCVQAYQVIGCQGWARIDVMLDAESHPLLLEINTSPGMTSHSLVPMAAKAEGINYADLCFSILASAACKLRHTTS